MTYLAAAQEYVARVLRLVPEAQADWDMEQRFVRILVPERKLKPRLDQLIDEMMRYRAVCINDPSRCGAADLTDARCAEDTADTIPCENMATERCEFHDGYGALRRRLDEIHPSRKHQYWRAWDAALSHFCQMSVLMRRTKDGRIKGGDLPTCKSSMNATRERFWTEGKCSLVAYNSAKYLMVYEIWERTGLNFDVVPSGLLIAGGWPEDKPQTFEVQPQP